MLSRNITVRPVATDKYGNEYVCQEKVSAKSNLLS